MKPFLAAVASLLLIPVVNASPQYSFPNNAETTPKLANIDLLGDNYQRLMRLDTWLDSHELAAAKQQIIMAGESRVDEQLTQNWQQLDQLEFSLKTAENRQLFANALLYAYRYKESMAQVGVDWFFQPNSKKKQTIALMPELTQARALNEALRTQQFAAFVATNQAHYQQFQQMAAVKNHFDTLADISWPQVNEPVKVVRDNEPLQSATQVIDILAILGDISAEQAQDLKAQNLTYLSAELQTHIRTFQRRHGLFPDGVIGPKTLAWLNAPIEKRKQLLALNMLRLSLWPEDKKGIVVVNVPAFEMDVWVDEQRVFETRVIVGRPSRPTPIFVTRLDSIVFNPGWNIPVTIMREDIIPKAKYDQTYLPSKGYEILQSWNHDAPIIPPAEIDWQSVNPKRFPYRMRQPPGNSNALGRYKFNTPNNMAIYLHDTPSKSLFNRENRSLSSGCVRVEHANEFANTLLTLSKHNPKNYEYLQQNDGEIKTKAISLGLKLPVHMIYQTAWVDEKGLVNFRSDIYDFDQPLIEPEIRQTVSNSQI